VPKLVDVLRETNQVIPDALLNMMSRGGYGGRGGGRGGYSSKLNLILS
jgi:hypothetical protein